MRLKNDVPKSRTQRSTKLSHASIALYSITYCLGQGLKCQEETAAEKKKLLTPVHGLVLHACG